MCRSINGAKKLKHVCSKFLTMNKRYNYPSEALNWFFLIERDKFDNVVRRMMEKPWVENFWYHQDPDGSTMFFVRFKRRMRITSWKAMGNMKCVYAYSTKSIPKEMRKYSVRKWISKDDVIQRRREKHCLTCDDCRRKYNK